MFLPENIESFAPDLSFQGTVWRGGVSGLPVFGEANFDTELLSRRALITSGQGANYLSAELSPSGAKDLDLRVELETLPITDGRLQGVQGLLLATISEIELDGQSCASATGTLRTDVLQRNGGAIAWTGPELTGPIFCQGGALVATLTGRDTEQVIEAKLRMSPDSSYRAEIEVRTSRAEANAILPLFGFSRSGLNYVLTEQGRWR